MNDMFYYNRLFNYLFLNQEHRVRRKGLRVIKCPIKNVNKAYIQTWPFHLLVRFNNIKNKKIHKYYSKN